MFKKYSPWLVLACILYFPFFLHLDNLTLSIYDEARRGLNAFEMVQNGNILVTYFEGEPDMWGTKPPMLIWLQAAFMKILGYNELAVRLPAALAGLALSLYLLFFSKQTLNNITIGVASLLVLITSSGFISDHVTRTGDFDALLCLWLMLYLLSFFKYTQEEDPKKKKKHLYLFALFIVCAVLTKGIAGFFFLPGIFLYALFSKQVLPMLKSKYTWIALSGVLIGVLGFYFLRELYNPGYIEAVWNNEIGGRYQNSLEGQEQSVWFYFLLIIEKDFHPWFFMLPFGLIAGYFGTKKERSLTILLVVNALTFLFIISNAGTKHFWYNAPVFASLALLCSFGIAFIFQLGYQKINSTNDWNRLLFIVSLFILFFGVPYYNIVNSVYQPELLWNESNGYPKYIRNHKDLNHYQVGNDEYNAHTLFYLNTSRAAGKDIIAFYPKNKQDKGNTYLLCGSDDKNKFYARHIVNVIETWEDCQLVEIESYKEENN